jgi:hypothetical protein
LTASVKTDEKKRTTLSEPEIPLEQKHPFSHVALVQDQDAYAKLYQQVLTALHGKFYGDDGDLQRVISESNTLWQLMVMNKESWSIVVDSLVARRFTEPGTPWDPNGQLATKFRNIMERAYQDRLVSIQHLARAVAKKDHAFFTSTQDFLLKAVPTDVRQEIVDRMVKSRTKTPAASKSVPAEPGGAALGQRPRTQPEAGQHAQTGDVQQGAQKGAGSDTITYEFGSGEAGVDLEQMTRNNILCRQVDDKPWVVAFGFSDLPAHPWYRNPKAVEPQGGFVSDLYTPGVRPDGSIRTPDGNVRNEVGRLSVADRMLETIDISRPIEDDSTVTEDEDGALLRLLGMSNVTSYVDDPKEAKESA